MDIGRLESLSYQITNISSTRFSDISPGKSKLVETEKEVQYYQRFIDTGLLSVQEVKKKEKVSKSKIAKPTTRAKNNNDALGKSEEMEIKENG